MKAEWILIAVLLAVIAVMLLWGGCITQTDPATGQKMRSLDPNSPLVTGGEAVAEGVGVLGPLFGGVGGLAAGVATGILAAWRKVKPSLTLARTEAEHYHAAAAATVTAIDEFKTLAPEAWTQLKGQIEGQLRKQGLDPLVVENVIRGLRGLPVKT